MSRPYERLIFYQNICEIRKFVFFTTERLKRDHLRLVSQMRDAARSAKQNIKEGYRRGSLAQFVNYLKISLASLEELSGDVDDCLEDNLITKNEYDYFVKLYRSAEYLTRQYLKSMYTIEKQGTWKVPGEGERKRSRNVP
ncbi:MAG: four helix bundle protein [Candidatus Margulisiibacteriota bacterium]